MDATPGLVTSSNASYAQRLRLQVDRSVDATPPAIAPASAKCSHVGRFASLVQRRSGTLARLPGLRSRSSCRMTAHPPLVGTAGRRTAAQLLRHGRAPRHGHGALAQAQGQKAQKVCSDLPTRQPASMSQRPLTITQHLQALHDMVHLSDIEQADDKAADLFASLDRVWQTTHREKLTTQSFADNLKTFLLIRGGIAPSSPAAEPVTDLVKALTRLRLRLLVERGPGYGHTMKDGGQVQPNVQTTTTPEEAAPLADSGRRGVFVSTVATQTPLTTCTGWLAAIRAHSCHHDWKRSTLCCNLALYGTRGANESWNMSRRESYRTERWRLLVSFPGGRSPLLQTCLQMHLPRCKLR